MSLEYDDCLKKGKVKPFSRGNALSSKELDTAVSDLERARETYKIGDHKWATIQIYYSMFHCARALIYAKDLREHSHYCLILAMRELYVSTGQIPAYMIEGLQEAKNLREDADYYSRWSQQGCEKLLKVAGEFIDKAKTIIGERKT